MKRILIYSHDTFGLGNIRRMLEIARHLVQSSPQVSVLVLTGSPMLHAFRIPPRVDYVKLPCLSRNSDGHYAARNLDLSLAATVRLRANIIRSAIADFAPDLILVDKKPFGVEDELCGAFEALSRNIHRPKMVLLLRDILDSPEVTTAVWRKNGYCEAIDAYYDQVLVVGSPRIFDLRLEYAFPAFTAAKVKFCGYLGREPGREPRSVVRRRLGLFAREPLVLVTTGGGEDGYQLIDNYLRGVQTLPAVSRPRTHIVCGPEMAEAQRVAIATQVSTMPQVSVQDFSDDMMSLIDAADVVVSMGGYNTVCELLTLRKRAVVVPRVKPGREQSIRAARMAALGLLRMVHTDVLSPDALLQAVQTELTAVADGNSSAAFMSLYGQERTTAAIFELIGLETLSATTLQNHDQTSRATHRRSVVGQTGTGLGARG